MIAEQLQAARAAHWRQQHPLLTLEDAQGWLKQHPLCLYLPRRAQLPAPAPSFVEACLGKAQATPDGAAIEQAQDFLTRLTASGAVVPLNLLGTVGEQPDFLATGVALPFVLSLRGDADWKHAPQKSSGHKVSPLVLELWKLLEQQGALTAVAARESLGRELTEAAVLRALAELWQGLRISPVYGEDGQAARWEMMRVRHREALTTAGGTGQVTAISLLVSMYLQSVYAATGEEIEIFLSPVTSRSRVREAVRGLSATRQIHSLSMDAQTYYFLENGLPEFATVTVADTDSVAEQPVRPKRREHPLAPPPGAVAPLPPARLEGKPERDAQLPAARSGWKSPERAATRPRQTADPSAPPRSGRDDKGKAARPSGFVRTGAPRTGAPPRPGGAGRPAAAGRAPFKSRSGPARSGPAGEAKPWRPKTNADPSAPLRSGQDDKGRVERPGGFVRSGAPRAGSPRAGVPRAGAPSRPGGDAGRPAAAGRAAAGGRPPFKSRSGPPRSGPAGGPRPWRPKTAADPSAPLHSGRDDKGRAERPGRFVRAGAPARPREGGERRPAAAGRPPFKPRSGPPRTGTAGGPRPWRPKTAAGSAVRDDTGRAAKPGGFARAGAPPRSGGGAGRPAAAGRPPFKSRSGPPRSGPAGGPRPWRPKTTAGPSAPLRSGRDDKGRAARPGGFARAGAPARPREGGEGRPPFKPRSGAPRSGPPGPGGGEGRPPFKPRSGPPKGGPRSGRKHPGDYPRRKPDRKKPGA